MSRLHASECFTPYEFSVGLVWLLRIRAGCVASLFLQ